MDYNHVTCNPPFTPEFGYNGMAIEHGIVGIEGYVVPAIAFNQCNILHIGLRLMIQHHNLGLVTWSCHNTPATTPYESEISCNRMSIVHMILWV